MARKSKNNGVPSDGESSVDNSKPPIELTKEHAAILQSLVFHDSKLRLQKKTLDDDFKAAADTIGIKPAEVKEMVGWIIQEQEKGGVLTAKENKLDMVRKVLELFDDTPHDPTA